MWFGTGVHYALEQMYHPILKRDPVEAFLTWFNFQWEGGIVGPQWLERTYDIHPRIVPFNEDIVIEGGLAQPHYEITGLKDLLPDPIEEEFEIHRELGIGMLTFYKDYAEREDDFEVVAVESTYSIPLGFEVVDQREDSPNVGKRLEVHARGKRDQVIWWPERDHFGILENKTAARVDEDYFLKYEKDPQATNYLWATNEEAKMHDFPWSDKPITKLVVNALRKNYPKPPSILKSGYPSLNRSEEGTSAELFQELVLSRPEIKMWFQDNEKAQAYYQYLIDQGEKLFIIREPVYRNEHEILNAGEQLRMIAEEMLNPEIKIWPSPTGANSCLRCAFRAPCIAADDGSDWQGMLADGYETNRDR